MRMTTVYPLYADYAFPNTMKGQRGQINAGGNVWKPSDNDVYSRLYKMYFNWNELERTIADGEDYMLEVCNQRFADCREHNCRIIPRVALQWPNHGDHTKATEIVGCFAEDMVASTLDTPEFFFRVQNFIGKMGRVMNNDPRVAYVEAGIYGLWGEQHEDSLSLSAQENLANALHAAFPDKLIMIRCPRDCVGEGFGMYWDSFAHIDEEFYAQDCVRFMDWRKAVMGGEVAHNWGQHTVQPGDDMNDTLIDPTHKERFIDYVYWQHNNHLGMWLKQDERYNEALSGLAEYQKAAGYRYVLERVQYGFLDGQMLVTFDVTNMGASPFYYKWPVAASLLDLEGNVVWQGEFDADIRTWMPGEKWNFVRRAYDMPAKTNTVSARFDVSHIPQGVYLLALGILDAGTKRPNVLFATRQYKKGGWHPIGRIGIETTCEDPHLPAGIFDDQRADDSLSY